MVRRRVILSRAVRGQSGVAAIELALVLPILLLIYFGMVDLSHMIATNRKITNSANLLGDLVTQHDTSLPVSAIDDYFRAVDLMADTANGTGIRSKVLGYRTVSGIPTQVWKRENRRGPNCADPDEGILPPLTANGNDIVVAVVCTKYTFEISNFLGNIFGSPEVILRQQIALRPRQSFRLDCVGC